jgi:hypothetical protein
MAQLVCFVTTQGTVFLKTFQAVSPALLVIMALEGIAIDVIKENTLRQPRQPAAIAVLGQFQHQIKMLALLVHLEIMVYLLTLHVFNALQEATLVSLIQRAVTLAPVELTHWVDSQAASPVRPELLLLLEVLRAIIVFQGNTILQGFQLALIVLWGHILFRSEALRAYVVPREQLLFQEQLLLISVNAQKEPLGKHLKANHADNVLDLLVHWNVLKTLLIHNLNMDITGHLRNLMMYLLVFQRQLANPAILQMVLSVDLFTLDIFVANAFIWFHSEEMTDANSVQENCQWCSLCWRYF